MSRVNVEASAPLRCQSDSVAATLNAVLHRAGFSERSICERLGITTLTGIETPVFKTLVVKMVGAGALEMLARLFVFGESVERRALGAHLSADEFDAFLSCDLLRDGEAGNVGSDRVFSPVRLVPVETPASSRDLLLVGDRGDHPDRSPFVPFGDIVFSGHNPLTRQFLQLLPYTPCDDALDVCAGTGVAALALSPFAKRSVAADIAARSTHFAGFNAWLNGGDGVEVTCGDLYEAVAGRRFDRIVAHPPYVPALTHRLTYRDGGQTGDEIVQRVIAGVPQHLNVGGTFHLLCLAMDTEDGSFEERARAWLGEAGAEFDLIFALDSRTPPEMIATSLVERAGESRADLERWRDLFQGLHVKEFVYGALVGRRFATDRTREAFTRRVLLTPESTAEGFQRLLNWFDWLRLPDLPDRVMSLAPRLPRDLHLEVRHTVENDTFVPTGYALSNGGKPFFARIESEAWVVALLNDLDGVRTVRQVSDSARARGRVPPDFSEDDLVRMITFLLERGCVSNGG